MTNGPKELIARVDAPDTEVELSAEDLLALAKPIEPKPTTTTIAATAPARQTPGSRLSLSAIPVVGAVGALSLIMALSDAPPSEPPQLAQAASQAESAASAAKPTREGKPVLFVNPFDAKEVFEFPAGTSEAEARDAVAQILMDRAMQRQRDWDQLVSRGH